MKSVTRQKTDEDILKMLEQHRRIFIVGCGTCATTFETGGLDQVLSMKEKLQESGFMVTGLTVIPTACDEMTAASAAENETAIKGANAVLVMSCALGVQRLSFYLDKPVLPALDTLFIGLEERPGYYMEACDQCGQCILGYTAGICPLTACHKGLLNGPCGGTNKGKCEVDKERDCAFTLIYNRLKEQDRLDLLKVYHPPRNAQVSTRPRVKILEPREVASWAGSSGS